MFTFNKIDLLHLTIILMFHQVIFHSNLQVHMDSHNRLSMISLEDQQILNSSSYSSRELNIQTEEVFNPL